MDTHVKEEVFSSEDLINDEKKIEEQNTSQSKQNGVNNSYIEERIQPSKVFQRFGGKIFDPSQPTNGHEIYNNITSKSDAKFETPLQKYRRLQFEMTELAKQLDDTLKGVASSNDSTKDVMKYLNQELSKSSHNVEEFKTNPQLASLFAEANANTSNNVDANYLFKKLHQFQAEQRHNNDETSSKDNHASLTLYLDNNGKNKSFHLQEIENRVQLLEKIIGQSPENPSIGDMISSVKYLNKHLELISDETKLESLVRRVQTLRKELQAIQAKASQQMEDQITKTKEEKIEKLSELMQRSDQTAVQLPTIVSKLHSLKSLHEDTANVVEKVQNIEIQQKLIQQTLESNKQILNEVSQSLAENQKVITTNIQSFEFRINQVQERFKKMGL